MSTLYYWESQLTLIFRFHRDQKKISEIQTIQFKNPNITHKAIYRIF